MGGERFVSQRVETVYNHNAKLTGLVGTLQDITEKKVQEDRIRHLAYYDEVTQLPNRAFFLKFLAKTIDLAKKDNRIFAVLFLDLDGFKGINDTYGHQAGDLLLKEISRRLTEGLRCSDMASRYLERLENGIDVARLGGDEFVILLNNLARPDQAATVAERIQGWITEPVPLGDRLAHVGVSTGIAVYPHNGEDSVTLLKNADIAMYHAKKFGKGHFRFFHEEMATAAKRRLEMETHMHHAIANGELRLFYQAIIDAETGRLAGAEVLLRWDSVKLGFLLPDDFIPLAEENGMIIPFGEWAVREACCQNQAWRLEGLDDLGLSINIGSLQFNDVEFVPMIVQAIQEYGISPESLTFEMAESTLMADSAKTGEKMAELKGLGVKLALDGFGTGYSSMRCPGLFPLDTIKVNLAFVNGLPPGADAAGMVNAVLAMARALKLRTVVTGVETLQQRDALVDVASGAMQGYYFSRPMAADEFKAVWLQKGGHPGLKRGQFESIAGGVLD
jgi:diguanylate cyclase (GGDEF)-like protein